uniref:Uncharacterized protein n=1 Tax=Brassica oleracea var. oleracea TaxID=109376 RepID=A0A0D3B3J1_BRAOL
MNLRLPLRTPPRIIMYVCLGPESRAPTSSSSSSQAWLVVVVQFVFQPAAPDSPSATPVIIPSWLSFRSRSLTAPPMDISSDSPTPSCSRPSPSSESAVVTAEIVGIEVKKNDNGDL